MSHVVFKVICNYSTFQGVITALNIENIEHIMQSVPWNIQGLLFFCMSETIVSHKKSYIKETQQLYDEDEWPGTLLVMYKMGFLFIYLLKMNCHLVTDYWFDPGQILYWFQGVPLIIYCVCGFSRRINKSLCSFTVLNIEHWLTPQNINMSWCIEC